MNESSKRPRKPSAPASARRVRLIGRAAMATIVVLAVGITAALLYREGYFSGRDADGGPGGQVAIGGPFTMTNQDGKTVTDADFHGKYMLVYFGYTYCPDVCPATLYNITQAMAAIGPLADKVTPVFITVDPARDTPARMKNYVANFDKRMVGLTGTPEQLKTIAKEYRVYYAKVPAKDGDANSYLMNHSSVMYLMDPDGHFKTHFSAADDSKTLAAKLKTIL